MGFIRYPGGKQRLVKYILPHLLSGKEFKGRFVEPFLGSGAVFFALRPYRALLSDLNKDLIDLYQGIKNQPSRVWDIFKDFPNTKKGYYIIRGLNPSNEELAFRSARILFLSRTCFKGMWRYNSKGEFTVGYGGQDRRWTVTEETLRAISRILANTALKCCDFEEIITSCNKGDLVFVDPPYCPGKCELINSHYIANFQYREYERLSRVLEDASSRGVLWAMTTSSHSKILRLFKKYRVVHFPIGTGNKPGIQTRHCEEVLICNH